MEKALLSKSPRNQTVNISTIRATSPWYFGFSRCRLQISGSSSDAQILNHSKLKRRTENRTLGLPPPEPLGPVGPDPHYFLLGDDAFALLPLLIKPYSRRQLTREETIANYRISRERRVVENSFGIPVKRFRVLLTTMEQRPKVVTDIVLTCVAIRVASRQTTHSSRRHTTTTGGPGGTETS